MTRVHPTDSKNRPSGLPKNTNKYFTHTFPGLLKISHLFTGL